MLSVEGWITKIETLNLVWRASIGPKPKRPINKWNLRRLVIILPSRLKLTRTLVKKQQVSFRLLLPGQARATRANSTAENLRDWADKIWTLSDRPRKSKLISVLRAQRSRFKPKHRRYK